MSISKIYKTSIITNKNAHRLASDEYYLVYIQNVEGEYYPALFTQPDIAKALFRANRNPEDAPVLKDNLFVKFMSFIKNICR